jgi:hypothetical protein
MMTGNISQPVLPLMRINIIADDLDGKPAEAGVLVAAIACRTGCGACCIAPSISSPIPQMPDGKPAGVRCIQLNVRNQCDLFGLPTRPLFCGSLQPSLEMCGLSDLAAMHYLTELEQLTSPVI